MNSTLDIIDILTILALAAVGSFLAGCIAAGIHIWWDGRKRNHK